MTDRTDRAISTSTNDVSGGSSRCFSADGAMGPPATRESRKRALEALEAAIEDCDDDRQRQYIIHAQKRMKQSMEAKEKKEQQAAAEKEARDKVEAAGKAVEAAQITFLQNVAVIPRSGPVADMCGDDLSGVALDIQSKVTEVVHKSVEKLMKDRDATDRASFQAYVHAVIPLTFPVMVLELEQTTLELGLDASLKEIAAKFAPTVDQVLDQESQAFAEEDAGANDQRIVELEAKLAAEQKANEERLRAAEEKLRKESEERLQEAERRAQEAAAEQARQLAAAERRAQEAAAEQAKQLAAMQAQLLALMAQVQGPAAVVPQPVAAVEQAAAGSAASTATAAGSAAVVEAAAGSAAVVEAAAGSAAVVGAAADPAVPAEAEAEKEQEETEAAAGGDEVAKPGPRDDQDPEGGSGAAAPAAGGSSATEPPAGGSGGPEASAGGSSATEGSGGGPGGANDDMMGEAAGDTQERCDSTLSFEGDFISLSSANQDELDEVPDSQSPEQQAQSPWTAEELDEISASTTAATAAAATVPVAAPLAVAAAVSVAAPPAAAATVPVAAPPAVAAAVPVDAPPAAPTVVTVAVPRAAAARSADDAPPPPPAPALLPTSLPPPPRMVSAVPAAVQSTVDPVYTEEMGVLNKYLLANSLTLVAEDFDFPDMKSAFIPVEWKTKFDNMQEEYNAINEPFVEELGKISAAKKQLDRQAKISLNALKENFRTALYHKHQIPDNWADWAKKLQDGKVQMIATSDDVLDWKHVKRYLTNATELNESHMKRFNDEVKRTGQDLLDYVRNLVRKTLPARAGAPSGSGGRTASSGDVGKRAGDKQSSGNPNVIAAFGQRRASTGSKKISQKELASLTRRDPHTGIHSTAQPPARTRRDALESAADEDSAF